MGCRSMTSEKREFIDDAEGRCQLCGRKRDLELHHIIPLAYGGPDIKENWIMVCRACHALLTPHRALTLAGLRKTKMVYATKLIKITVDMLDKAFPEDEWLEDMKQLVSEDLDHITEQLKEAQ